jgi:hypothetical protein
MMLRLELKMNANATCYSFLKVLDTIYFKTDKENNHKSMVFGAVMRLSFEKARLFRDTYRFCLH